VLLTELLDSANIQIGCAEASDFEANDQFSWEFDHISNTIQSSKILSMALIVGKK
jgi:hypothetical protein